MLKDKEDNAEVIAQMDQFESKNKLVQQRSTGPIIYKD